MQRENRQQTWQLWQDCTTATSADFAAPVGDGLYEFAARTQDNIGNIEPFTNDAEASVIVDTEAPFITEAAYLPIVFRNSAH